MQRKILQVKRWRSPVQLQFWKPEEIENIARQTNNRNGKERRQCCIAEV
jgi:hypothetical protein